MMTEEEYQDFIKRASRLGIKIIDTPSISLISLVNSDIPQYKNEKIESIISEINTLVGEE